MTDRGRPSLYTPEIAELLCTRLAAGESLRKICRDEDMPSEVSVRTWALNLSGNFDTFSAQYATARRIGYEQMAEDVIEIADDSSQDVIDTDSGSRMNTEYVARSRLRVDTRKWLLSKVLPKLYGDKLTLAGDEEAPLQMLGRVELVGVRAGP